MQEHAPFRHQKTSSAEPWQQELVSHAPEYGAEFVGTTFLMLCVVGAVGVMFAHGSPAVSAIPSVQLRLFLTGLVLGGAGSLVAITPLGRLSGAHLNPAISLGFFMLGRMQLQDLLGYVVAQTAGASLGAWTGQLAFRGLASGVRDALNQPGRLVGPQAATAAEAVATFALAAVVFSMVSRRSLARWTPLVVVGVVAVIVWLDGNFSGASLNPARSFGPALITADWHLFWIYAIGPCSGAIAAALVHRFATPLEAVTGKLFHDLHYRSIFSGALDHAANQTVRQHAAMPAQTRPPIHRTHDATQSDPSRPA
ncbi:MAG TPA: aquaporin [Candidatus Angelobacter sp.]|nr:aquaporin [Candidatus Angelobacter sp.]